MAPRNRRKPIDRNHQQERQDILVSDSYKKDLQKSKDNEQNSSQTERGSEPKSDIRESGYTSTGTSPNDSISSDSIRTGYEALDQNEILEKCGLELKHEPLISPDLPKRPGFGTLGKKIRLISNFFPIVVPRCRVYHYDVDVSDVKRDTDDKVFCEEELDQNADEVIGKNREVRRYRCFKTKEKRKIVQAMLDRDALFKGLFAAYDGEKNLYTKKPLSSTSFPHTFVTNEDDEIKGQVKIKPVKKKDTTSCAIRFDTINDYFNKITNAVPLEAIAALETILRHGACLRLTPVGRSFFTPPSPMCLTPLGGGLEVWFGYHQGIVINQWNLSVNLDVSATTFLPGGPLLKFIVDLLDISLESLLRQPLQAKDVFRINRRLKDRKIKTTHTSQGRKYTVLNLLSRNAHELVVGEEANAQTVAQYFRDRYNKVLKFPYLPCLQVKPEKRNIFLPLEVCDLIPGQHYNKELSKAQTNQMIKFTSPAPRERFNKIREKNNFDADETVNAFKIEVSKVPMPVEGRVLDPPSLMYGEENKVRPRDGVWNMIDKKFSSPVKIKSWVIISFVYTRKMNMNTFCSRFREVGRNLGVKIDEHKCVKFPTDGCDFEELLSNVKSNASLAVVIIPDEIKNESIYRNIKKSGETAVGLITQVITEKTFLKIANPNNKAYGQLVANIFLKINSKMGGINYSLILSEIPSILWTPTIVIGADVNHPGAYRGFKHSLAACAGSLDARCSLYAVRTRPQQNLNPNKKTEEIILDLESMVADLLRAFYRHTRQKPEKIVFYRDGVSDGEFQKVRKSEVVSVRKACLNNFPDYKPAITFIVVQKRHHMRAMLKDPRDSRNLNPPAGTVMDSDVGHPENFDFYLSSHNCPKGTARPAHYTVIEDDSNFSADDLQKFTNQLCYTFVRCTKSISVPAPVQYAHLAAYRARQYLESGGDGSTSGSRASSTGLTETTIEDVNEVMKVIQDLKNSMYFV